MNALYTRATVGIALAAAFIGSLFLPPQPNLPPAQVGMVRFFAAHFDDLKYYYFSVLHDLNYYSFILSH